MKKFVLLIGLLFLTNVCYAGQITAHTTYGTTSQVTSTTLNGNVTAITNVVNGGLDNTNADTTSGYRFYEVRSSLPSAGTQGRTVFLTTDDTIYIDTGSAWVAVFTVTGTPAQGDIVYRGASGYTLLSAGTDGKFLKTQGTSANPTWDSPTGFTNRGDPASNDFGVGDLTLDGTWNDLDLSSIVSAGATAVALRVQVSDETLSSIIFRRNGNSNTGNNSACYNQVASISIFYDIIVPCDTDRIIEYYGDANVWAVLNIVVKGWWN